MKANITFRDGKFFFYEREIESEDRETIESRIEEILNVTMEYGYLDDTDPEKWRFIPSHAITQIEIDFIEDEDDAGRPGIKAEED